MKRQRGCCHEETMIDLPQSDNLKDPAFLQTLEELINGRLTPEAAVCLRERLLNDDAARLVYVEYMDLHAELAQFATNLPDGNPITLSSSVRSIRIEELTERRNSGVLSPVLTLPALAVTVLVALGYFLGGHHLPWNAPAPPGPLAGKYEALSNTVWAGSRTEQKDAVRSGERLQAMHGRFLLRLNSGVLAACVAPIDLEVRGPGELFVHHGDVCVHVPKQARGFRVDTRSMNIIDLGTVFGVRAEMDGTSEMHVLEGRVKARSGNGEYKEVTAGFALSTKQTEKANEVIPATPELFELPLSSLAGIAATTGGVQLLFTPPASVQHRDLVTAATVCLFLEQPQTAVEEELPLAQAAPGRYDEKHPPASTVIPPQTVVTTYFLNAQNSLPTPAEGTVTFDRPILGLALSAEQLNRTDQNFGNPSVLYPAAGPQGRGTVINESMDEIEISPDRRTLRVRMGCSKGSFDQIRVFVDAAVSTDSGK